MTTAQYVTPEQLEAALKPLSESIDKLIGTVERRADDLQTQIQTNHDVVLGKIKDIEDKLT